MKRAESIAAWITTVIFLQTLFFKFTGAPESKFIFETLGVEPWGRILSGVAELVAAVLLIIPRTRLYGGLMGMGIMSGAIASFLSSAFVVYLRKNELPLKAFGLAVILR